MYASNFLADSARAIDLMLAKHEHNAINSVSLRELIQPRWVIEKYAKFPPKAGDNHPDAPRVCVPRGEDIRREVMRLRMEGLTYTQVSKTLNVPVGTCKTIVFQSRKNV